jgi:putative transposase
MARLTRLTLPDRVHHLAQRGNNGQTICATSADHQCLHALLVEHSQSAGVEVHGYVLLGNEFQLLATPRDAQGVPRLMQSVGRRYVRYFNDVHGRTGTLWEGRYRSTLLQPERYLLACLAYMDLAPVREGLVGTPAAHPWGSHSHYVGARVDRLITPHALIWSMGNTPFSRELAYGEFVQEGLNAVVCDAITRSVARGWPLGDQEFIAQLQQQTDRRLLPARPGRPRKLV